MQRLRKTAIPRWRHYLFYVFTFIALCTCPALQAQVGSKQIVFEAKGELLSKAITRLSKASGVNIGYPTNEVKSYKNISLPKGSRTVLETLKALLKGTELDCKPVAEILVVFKKTVIETTPANKTFINVSGKVVDENGQALPGISITIQNTGRGTITDGSGGFTFDQVEPNSVLIAQGVGYPAKQLPANTIVTVHLERFVSNLDEVQVIAYGTTTKRLNTGNVTTVTADEIARQPVTNPLAALQGRVPGLLITQTSGVPGGAFKVQLRGQSYLDASISQNDPLIIVDGIPFEAGNRSRNQLTSAANNPTSISEDGLSPLNMIPLSEIESINVLKDADATSIYGSRGANGVILITTKRGKTGTTNVTLNTNTGWSQVGRNIKFLDRQQYLAMRREAFKNDSLTVSAVPGSEGFAPDLMLWDTTTYTDFTKLLVGNTASKFDANLSVSGGNAYTQFLISGSYHGETTIYGHDFSNRNIGLQASVSHKSRDEKFSISFVSIYSNDNTKLPSYDLSQFVQTVPTLKLYDSLGNINWQDKGIDFVAFEGSKENPLYSFNKRYNSQSDNLNTNVLFGYKIIPSITVKVSSGYNMMITDENGRNPSTSISPLDVAGGTMPSAKFGSSTIRSWISEPQVEFSKKTGLSKINLLAGSTFQSKTYFSDLITASNYSSDLLLGSPAAAGFVQASNNESRYRYNAFFSRGNYNYGDRYMVTINVRRDGSSRFAPENRWSNFGSVGGAWIITNEKFAKVDSQTLFSFGKIRGSYGTAGNDQIGDYKYLSLWTNTNYPYNGVAGLYPSRLYNPDYKWELIKKLEVALDIGLLQDKIMLSTVYYRNKSSNQLVNYSLPFQTGFSNVIQNFPGLVRNTGWEFALRTKNFRNANFIWKTDFNLTLPKNKLISFPNLNGSPYANSYVIGRSLTIFRGYKYTGIDVNTGMYTFEDLNNDGQMTESDLQWFEDLDPKFYGGLQNTITYKNWSLNFLIDFRKQTGTNYLAQLAAFAPGQMSNQPVLALNRWQQPGDEAELQRFTAGQNVVSYPYLAAAANFGRSNGRYTDASFVKFRNASIYYSLDSRLIQRLNLKSLRVYAQGQNLFTLTDYKGADPEVQNLFQVSPLRTIVVGIQTTF